MTDRSIDRRENERCASSWRRGLLFCGVVAVLLLSLSSPAQARWCHNPVCPGDIIYDARAAAQRAMIFAKEIAEYTKMLNLYNWINQGFEDGLTRFREIMETDTALKIESEKAKLEHAARLSNAKADTVMETAMINGAAQIAAEASAPDPSTDILCYTITTRQLLPVMLQFSNTVSGMVLRGYLSERTGDGPYAAHHNLRMMCGINPTDPKTGRPMDGLPPGCTAPPQAPDSMAPPLEGAGESAFVLDPETTVLTVPAIQKKTVALSSGSQDVTIPVAQKDNLPQQHWIAARDYCYRVAGPTPLPPKDKENLTPSGQTKGAVYASCMAKQTQFVKQCADRIGYISRPDCSNPDFQPFCEAVKDACIAARAHNIPLPDRFENCAKGLSLYEVEYVAYALCMSTGRNVAMTQAGADAAELVDMGNYCAKIQSEWQARKDLEQNAFLRAIEGVNDLKSCWAPLKH